jgi:hypothetical protein
VIVAQLQEVGANRMHAEATREELICSSGERHS